MTALKPCPFCGETNRLTTGWRGAENFAVCLTCNAQGPTHSDLDAARKAWNRRAERKWKNDET